MSYADNVLRRRQELNTAFRERYNPMESVVAALSEIDKQAKEDELRQAREKRDVEKYGLEKERILAQTEKLKTDRTASEEALAAQRRAREAEFQARAARQQEEARLKEQAESRKTGARTLRGMLQGRGQTARDVWGGVGVEEAEKAYAKRLPRALVEGTAEEVARMDEELAAIKERAPKKIPGGLTREEIDEVAGAFGMTFDEALSLVSDMEQEEKDRLEKMGLTGARTEEVLTRADLNRRKGFPKAPKAKTPEEIEAAKEELAYKRLRNKRIERALSEKGGFVPTEEQVNKLQDARKLIQQARASTNVLRQLMNEFPDFKSYVGPIDGLITKVKAKFGSNSKEASKIKSTIDRVFQAYKTATTGAAAGELEMEDLKNIMPKDTDNFETILGKLDSSDLIAQTIVDQVDIVLREMDIRAADPLARGQMAAGTVAPAAPMTDEEEASYEE